MTGPTAAQRVVLDLLADGADHNLYNVHPATVQALRRRKWIEPVNGRPWWFRITDGGRKAQGVVWLEPRLVVEISYSELMQGRLRDPVLRSWMTERLLRPTMPLKDSS